MFNRIFGSSYTNFFFLSAPIIPYFLKFWASLPLVGLRQLPNLPKGSASLADEYVLNWNHGFNNGNNNPK